MERAIKTLKDWDDRAQIIAGNVCTAQGAQDLVGWGADAVKVGCGPGAACTTRVTTGFGVPQFQALLDVCAVSPVPVIADGGCRNTADIVKSFAAGASTVMLGKMFAACEESAAEKTQPVTPGGPAEARYRGQASASFQNDFYGGVKLGTVPEGEELWIPVTGNALGLLSNITGALRSALTYTGASNLREFRANVKWVEVTPSYRQEAGTRK
jgi:IMP dehydrogenase